MNLSNIVLIVAMIFVISAAGVSAAIIYSVVKRSNDSPSAFHQNIALVAFSIFVTAIVVLLGLVTLGTNPPASLQGRIGLITFNLAGPPAVWIVVFTVTARRFDLKSSANSNPGALIPGIDFERHYKLLGFDYYRNWKPALNQFRQVIDDSELSFIEDLLPKVFYHGPFDALKPEDVINTTLFVFSKGKAVKFQRIQGRVRTEGQRRSQVYLSQTSSTPNGQIACLHFIRSEERIRQTACHANGEWKVAPFDNIDIMLLAVYENDEVENGDYIYVDVSKYIDLARMDAATVEIAIAADRRIDEFCIWEVSASLASTERPVPLMFRRLENEPPKRNAADVDKNAQRATKLFDGWDTTLDQAFEGSLGQYNKVTRDQVQDFLRNVKGILGVYDPEPDTKSFHELFLGLRPADCVISTLKHQRNVILTTFTWG
jgi:hypothetical protein